MNPGEQNQDPYAQPGPIMSSSSDGTTQAPMQNNSNKYFGGRSKYAGPKHSFSQEENFMAAQTVASDPKLPKFSRESAAAQSMASYDTGERKDHRKLFILGGVGVVVLAIVVVLITTLSNAVPTTSKQDVYDNFRILANMAIFNKKTEKLDTDYDLDNGIVIVPFSNDYLGNQVYFQEVSEQAKKTINVVKGSPYDQETKDKVIDYAESILAWTKMAEYESFKKTIIGNYYSGDEAKAKAAIEDQYRPLADSKNQKLQFAASRYKDAANYYLNLIKLVAKDGKRLDTLKGKDEAKYQKDIDQFYSSETTLKNDADTAVGDEFTRNIRLTKDYAKMLAVEDKE
jgi:hypothetical protein